MERLGKIINTHGIKGELKISSSSDFLEERLKKGSVIYIEYGDKTLEYTVASYRVHKGFALISLKDNLDINLVEKYKNCIIYQEFSDVLLENDEFLYNELIGLEVYTTEKILVGVVDNVLEYPAQDLLVVKTAKKEVLIPFVKEIVLSVEDVITINALEGLL